MEPNLSEYKILTGDIWEWSVDQYFKGDLPIEILLKLRDSYQSILLKKAHIKDKTESIMYKPFVTVEDYDSGNHQAYYLRHMREWDSCSTIDDYLRLDYFCGLFQGKDAYFSYNQWVKVDFNNDYFDLWFALKLKQYEIGLKYLSAFLLFQLQEIFNNDYLRFKKFVEITTLQFQTIYNDSLLSLLKTELIDLNHFRKDKDITDNSLETNYRSFALKILTTNPGISAKGAYLDAIFDLYSFLKDKNLINDNRDNFSNLFGLSVLKNEDRVIWKGSNHQLRCFIDGITENLTVSDVGKYKWQIAPYCFIKKKGDKISEYTVKNLRDARGPESHLLDQLKNEIKSFESKINGI